MGFWSTIFRSDDSSEGSARVRQSNENLDHQRGDKYSHVDGGHVHQSYNINTSTGDYKEYSGGEHSSDRSYNKGK